MPRPLSKRPPLAALIFSVLGLLSVAGPGLAAGLDQGFGQGGVVDTPLSKGERENVQDSGQGPLIDALATAPGRKLVAALGSGGEIPYFGAVRFRTDGVLDRGFGEAGFAPLEASFPGVSAEAETEALAMRPGGGIVMAGFRRNRSGRRAPLLVALRPNGSPDRSFDADGLLASHPRSSGAEVLHGVAVARSGRVLAVGGRNERGGGSPAGFVVAYRPNGAIDTSFGAGGRVAFPAARDNDYTALRSIEVLPRGKLLVAGYLRNRLFLARLHGDGRLDRSFGGGDGKVSIGLGLRGCCPADAAFTVLADRGIVAFASLPAGGTKLVRLESSGARVRGFGRSGVVNDRNSRRLVEPGGLAAQPNGRLVLVGTTVRERRSNGGAKLVFAVLRYLPDGRPDRGFGRGGIELLPRGYDSIGAAALEQGGRVLAGGGLRSKVEGGFEHSLLLARLTG